MNFDPGIIANFVGFQGACFAWMLGTGGRRV